LISDKFSRNTTDSKFSVYRHPELVIQSLTDEEGLDKAYALTEQLYVHGDTMYVAGTSYLQDVWHDLKIHSKETAKAQRYMGADDLLEKNPQVSNLVGHSLEGSSVLELQKNRGETTFKTTHTVLLLLRLQSQTTLIITGIATTPTLSVFSIEGQSLW
jgi:hypothetical protein